MKQIYTLLAGTILLLSSCSSSRKAAQTPDDVYYSPASSGKTAAAAGDQDEYSSGKAQPGDYYSTAPNDQYVRMKSDDPRFSYFDDYNAYDSYYSPGLSVGMGYGYGFPSYGYGLGFGFGPSFGLGFGDPYMCWNSYFMWNSWYNPYFYNPYYGGGVIVAGKYNTTAVYSHLRAFNGTSYRNGLITRTSTSSNERTYRPRTSTTYYTPGSRSNRGNQLNTNDNRTFINNNSNYRSSNNNNYNNNNSNNYSRPSYSQPTRSYTPSSGGGGGGGFSRPGRH